MPRLHGLQSDHSKQAHYITAVRELMDYNRWSYGANRAQIDADIKVLSEFLSYLQTDKIRGFADISSFATTQASPNVSCA